MVDRETDRARAEVDRARAEAERERAEDERARAEAEQDRARFEAYREAAEVGTAAKRGRDEADLVPAALDGGLGIFGLGLFLFFISNLYAGLDSAWGGAWVILALSLVSMGYAFADAPLAKRRNLALGMGVVMLLLEVWAAILGVAWWIQVLNVVFAGAYIIIWAEYRFSAFGHVTGAEAHSAHGPPLRGRLLRGRHRQRA
jgi:cation transport ATPase